MSKHDRFLFGPEDSAIHVENAYARTAADKEADSLRADARTLLDGLQALWRTDRAAMMEAQTQASRNIRRAQEITEGTQRAIEDRVEKALTQPLSTDYGDDPELWVQTIAHRARKTYLQGSRGFTSFPMTWEWNDPARREQLRQALIEYIGSHVDVTVQPENSGDAEDEVGFVREEESSWEIDVVITPKP